MSPPTYPARPIDGGPLDLAPTKHGAWAYEPKINGWRALVHAPTGTMWNRHGQPLSIEDSFRPVLDRLASHPVPGLEWLDCEAFDRRHALGRGSLVILDLPLAGGTYMERQTRLYESFIEGVGIVLSWGHEQFPPPPNELLTFAYIYEEGRDRDITPLTAWSRLREVNRALGVELFEGLVAKKVTSPYPVQLRSPEQKFPQWMKHRWS